MNKLDSGIYFLRLLRTSYYKIFFIRELEENYLYKNFSLIFPAALKGKLL